MTYAAVTFVNRDNGTYPVTYETVNMVQTALQTLSAAFVAAEVNYSANLFPASQNVAYGATITVDASAGRLVNLAALTGNPTIAAPTNATAGMELIFVIPQDGTGSRTVTWNAVFHFTAGAAPTLTTTASKVDIVGFIYDGTYWRERVRSLKQA